MIDYQSQETDFCPTQFTNNRQAQESNGTESGISLPVPVNCVDASRIEMFRFHSLYLEIRHGCLLHDCPPHGGAVDHAVRISPQRANTAMDELSPH